MSGSLAAADGRLRRGCKDYAYAYSVTVPTQDWPFDVTLQGDRVPGISLAQAVAGRKSAAIKRPSAV